MRRAILTSRRLFAPAALLGLAALTASCSSGPASSNGSTTSTGATGTTAASGTTSSTAAPTTTLPPVPTSGPLSVGGPVVIPLAADQVSAAEGPDGAVFVGPRDPGSPAPSVVWVVDGNGPAAIAEHVAQGVAALAADADNLYVADYSSVTAFSRTSGSQDGQWSLPPVNTANASNDDLVAMAASGGSVLVSITQGNTVSVYRINPTTTAAPHMIAQGTGAIFGPSGSVYYERTDNRVVALQSSGSSTDGPILANHPNGLGGGVQYLDVVAGGVLWVNEPAGQGLDSQYSQYDATTLKSLGTYDGSTTQQIVDTAAGALVLSLPDGPVVCSAASTTSAASCVSRISNAGALTNTVAVGSAFQLLGPFPVVIGDNPTSTELVLQRLS